MSTTERRYDIDWLRVIAIGLLIFYHIGFVFLPWGVFIGFIQNEESIQGLWNPMSLLNIWRIPFLFFVSGMGVSFAIRKRSWRQLILERSRRILLPFLFGIMAIVPLHLFIWQKFYNQDLCLLHSSFTSMVSGQHIYLCGPSLTPLFLHKKEFPGQNQQMDREAVQKSFGIAGCFGRFCG